MNPYNGEWTANREYLFGPHETHGQSLVATMSPMTRSNEEAHALCKEIAAKMNLFPRVARMLKLLNLNSRLFTGVALPEDVNALLEEIECELRSTVTPSPSTENANPDTKDGFATNITWDLSKT